MTSHTFSPMASDPRRCYTCGGYALAAHTSSRCTGLDAVIDHHAWDHVPCHLCSGKARPATSYLLTVKTPDVRTFEAYWYGTGDIVDYDASTGTWTVDYGDDRYRAQYQADRFASGLYSATVSEVTR